MPDHCPTCGAQIRAVGRTTKRYEVVAEAEVERLRWEHERVCGEVEAFEKLRQEGRGDWESVLLIVANSRAALTPTEEDSDA